MSSERVNRPNMLKKQSSISGIRTRTDPSPKSISKKQVIKKVSNRNDKNNNLIRNELQDSSFNASSRPNKKVNMNHLLNFNSAPRNNQRNSKFVQSRPVVQRHQPRRPPINYVRTRCQTMLRSWSKSTPTVDQLNTDPNMYIEWDECISALKFFVSASNHHTCAICLSDMPIAPRSTRCGHLFCYPCILHHFSVIIDTNDGQDRKSAAWHKCPICHKEILKRKLKPGRICFIEGDASVGSVVDFNLVQRKKGSIFSYCNDQEFSIFDSEVSLEETQFTFVSLDYELNMLEEDLLNLEQNLLSAEEMEKPFYKEAIELTTTDIIEIKESIYKNGTASVDIDNFKVSSLNQSSDKLQYYQKKNQRVFLHPLIHRFLIEQFSDNLPKSISGRIVETESLQLYEEHYNRFKFLTHLPLGTTVQFVEVDVYNLKVDGKVVRFDKEVLEKLKPALQKRKKNRKEKKRLEKVYERNLEQHELEEFYTFDDGDFVSLNETEEPQITPEPVIVESYGLAAKLGTPKASSNIESYGFAARLRNSASITSSQTRDPSPPSCAVITVKAKKKNKKRYNKVPKI